MSKFKDNTPYPYTEPEQSKVGRFLTFSVLAHAGVILAIGMAAVPLTEKIHTETINIEIEESLPPTAKGIETAPTQGLASSAESAVPVPSMNESLANTVPITTEDIVAAKPIAPALPTKGAAIVKQVLKEKTPIAEPVAVASPVKINPTPTAKIATIDDIEAPEVDVAAEDTPSVSSTADDEDLDRDLENIDIKQDALLAKEKIKIAEEAQSIEAENELALQNAEAQAQTEQAAIASANAERRARDENAARDAASKRAAALAAAHEAARKIDAGDAHGEGAGNKGLDEESALAGVPNGVRSLDQLRQMPGNRAPQYSNRERLERQNGQVTFHAYVKKDGTIGGFRQVSSTGYANLDAKTLNALQQWKFYPGQEGWVELPFSWDLRGGAQSVDGMLRSKRSELMGR